MTPKELADRLNGSQYPFSLASVVSKDTAEHGLVVVYGASDDLMEFQGSINDEVGAYEGATVRVDRQGIVPEFDDLIDRGVDSKDALRDYFQRENKGAIIKALWCQVSDFAWTFETTIPHETFDIMEDGEPFCRGIVFRLADIPSDIPIDSVARASPNMLAALHAVKAFLSDPRIGTVEYMEGPLFYRDADIALGKVLGAIERAEAT